MMDYDSMWLGFNGQRFAKPFDTGRYKEDDEGLLLVDASRKVTGISNINYGNMWFGFEGQPLGLPFGIGRFRDVGEWYTITGTERDVADTTLMTIGTRRILLIPAPDIDDAIDHAERMRQHFISQFQWEVMA